MLFVDSDMLCVRPLDDIVERVRGGAVLAFEDLGRAGFSDAPLEPMGGSAGARRSRAGDVRERRVRRRVARNRDSVLRRFQGGDRAHRPRRDVHRRTGHRHSPSVHVRVPGRHKRGSRERTVPPARGRPAVSRRATCTVSRRPGRLEPPTCVDDVGQRPYILHHTLQKPWLEPLPENPYTTLLVNYVHHPAAPAVDESMLPRFLRSGPLARKRHGSLDRRAAMSERGCAAGSAFGDGLRSSRRSSKFVARPDARPAEQSFTVMRSQPRTAQVLVRLVCATDESA